MAANPIAAGSAPCHSACGVRSRGHGRAFGGTSVLSAVLLVVMPKCPYCLVGWAGALGLGGYATGATMIPTAVLVLFCASQAVFLFTTRRTGDRRALFAAGIGVALVLLGTLLDVSAAVRWVGIGVVVAASVLNAIATTRARLA